MLQLLRHNFVSAIAERNKPMQTYHLNQAQLAQAMYSAIEMYKEYTIAHEYNDEAALHAAVSEIIEGLNADRELEATDPTEKLRLQLENKTISFRERIQIHYEWEGEQVGGFTVQLFRAGKLQETKTELFTEAMSWVTKWHNSYNLPVETYGKWLAGRVSDHTAITTTYF